MIRRRHLLVGGAAVLAMAGMARAADSLTILLGAKAGSAPDEILRSFVPVLARHLTSVNFDVRNIPGSAGLAAAQATAAAPPTGAILGWAATPVLSARMVDRGADDLLRRTLLLGAVQREPIAFVAVTNTSLGSVQDVIGRSAEDADGVPLGTPPPGSPPHLAALRLQALAGTRLNIVTFPSASAARQAAVAGNVAAAVLGLSSAIGDLRGGRLTGLGVADDNRSEVFQDMPTLRDSGLDMSAVIYRGLAAPAGLPDGMATQLRQSLEAAANDPDFGDQANLGGYSAAWTNGEDWTAIATSEQTDLAKLWATEPWLQEGSG